MIDETPKTPKTSETAETPEPPEPATTTPDRIITVSTAVAEAYGLNLSMHSDRIIAVIWADLRSRKGLVAEMDAEAEKAMLTDWRDFARKEMSDLCSEVSNTFMKKVKADLMDKLERRR